MQGRIEVIGGDGEQLLAAPVFDALLAGGDDLAEESGQGHPGDRTHDDQGRHRDKELLHHRRIIGRRRAPGHWSRR